MGICRWEWLNFRRLPFEDAFLNRTSSRSSSSSRRKQEEKVAEIILFYRFQKLHQGVFGRNFDAFPSFTAMGICRWERFDFRRLPFEDAFLNRRSSRSSSSRRKQEEKESENILFYRFQKLHRRSFWAQFWCFSVLHCHRDLPLGVVDFRRLPFEDAFLNSKGVEGAGAAAAGGNRKKK